MLLEDLQATKTLFVNLASAMATLPAGVVADLTFNHSAVQEWFSERIKTLNRLIDAETASQAHLTKKAAEQKELTDWLAKQDKKALPQAICDFLGVQKENEK